jgi:WD40 repeat protein
MVRKQTEAHAGYLSRRELLQGLAGLVIALELEGCAQTHSASSMPTPVPTPRPPGSVLYTYHGHTNRVTTVAWSPDGKYIATGSANNTVRMWDATTGAQVFVYRGHQGSVNALAWSPDGREIASGAADNTVQILETATGKRWFTYRGHSNTVSAVSWSPDGKFIASGSWDKTVQVWNAASGALLYTYDGYNVKAARANPASGVLPDLIFAVAWSHNGRRIAAVTQVYCGDNCGVMLTWDVYTERNFSYYVDEPIFSMAWSPDDTRFVTAIVVSSQGFSQNGYLAQISQA